MAKARAAHGLSDNQIVAFDYTDAATYGPATADVDRVFLLGPPAMLGVDKILTPFIDFLKSAGIRRVVYVSALGADQMGDELDFHTKMEQKLAADGFDFTILKPSFFAQNFKTYEWENITQRGITFQVAGTGKVGFVDVRDVANVAAAALTQPGHTGKTYILTGPEALSYPDAAQLLTEVTGKPVVYPNPSPQAYTEALRGAGAPDFIAPYMISVYSLIADGKAAGLTTDIERLTGQKPTALKTVLERDFA